MIYENIRNLREDNDKTQKELADYLNVKQTTYSKYELGKINIPVEVFIKLADYYGVSVDYLLEMPNREKEAPLNCSGYTQDLMQLIQLYNAADMHEKGRILQFAIDLNDKDLHKK